MPSKTPSSSRPRFFSTATRARASVPPNFAYRAMPLVAATAATASPKLGRVARWYLPAMAAVALGMTFIPETFFDEPSKRTVTLGEANRRIDFAISHQLDEHNRRANDGFGPTLEERNRAMLNSFGGRSSLEDMERVIADYEDSFMPKGRHEKNMMLEEAYGERSNLKHLRRAMELYEVQ